MTSCRNRRAMLADRPPNTTIIMRSGPMAKKKKEEAKPEETPPPNGQVGPMLQVLAQYTKDQSFENPNAPDSLRNDLGPPKIDIQIEIGRQMLADDAVEVTLILKASGRREEQVAFIAELEYSGLFAFQNVNAQELQPIIMIECPRILFPFARQILAQMTQNGGFPPIMLEPPDFAGMFREEMMRRSAEGGEA